MIGLSTITCDFNGDLVLDESANSAALTYQRRITVTATLDGYSTLSDMGFTASDNVLTLSFHDLTATQVASLQYLISTYPLLTLTTKDGAFIGSLNNMSFKKAPATCNFMIAQQVS